MKKRLILLNPARSQSQQRARRLKPEDGNDSMELQYIPAEDVGMQENTISCVMGGPGGKVV